MTTVAEISGAVKRLPKKDLARFRKWFADYDAAAWDKQLEADVAAGRLDALVREARRDLKAGRTTPLCPTERLRGSGAAIAPCRKKFDNSQTVVTFC